ncbi:MAG: YlmC/YmxH family sporulation protein [Clostridia bacterium]|nr:YlmC/YmxH family sporulation protein [Clostridia bacterium]
MNFKQFTFCEMAKKTVVSVADGRTLGNVCDIVFGSNGCVIGFVVPGKKSFFKSITSSENVFIPWNKIVKIGSDVMLVSLVAAPHQNGWQNACTFEQQEEQPAENTEKFGQAVYHDEN